MVRAVSFSRPETGGNSDTHFARQRVAFTLSRAGRRGGAGVRRGTRAHPGAGAPGRGRTRAHPITRRTSAHGPNADEPRPRLDLGLAGQAAGRGTVQQVEQIGFFFVGWLE